MYGRISGRRRTGPAAWCGIMLALAPDPVPALPTQTFQVSASVVAGCQVGGSGVMGTLDFGTRSGVDNRPITAALVANASMTIACTPGTTLSMTIDGGHNHNTTRNLNLLNNQVLIPYRLFTSANFAPAGEIMVNQPVAIPYGDSNHISLPIYGQLQLNGCNQAGTYTDTLTITLTW